MNANGYLEGPQFSPDQFEVTFDKRSESWRVSSAPTDSTWNDTSNNQRVSLSNNDGTNVIHGDNQADFTADFDPNDYYGDVLVPKARLSRYGYDEFAKTPTTGFNGQSITKWEVYFDAGTLPITRNLTLEAKDFDNLVDPHDGAFRVKVINTMSGPNVCRRCGRLVRDPRRHRKDANGYEQRRVS